MTALGEMNLTMYLFYEIFFFFLIWGGMSCYCRISPFYLSFKREKIFNWPCKRHFIIASDSLMTYQTIWSILASSEEEIAVKLCSQVTSVIYR